MSSMVYFCELYSAEYYKIFTANDSPGVQPINSSSRKEHRRSTNDMHHALIHPCHTSKPVFFKSDDICRPRGFIPNNVCPGGPVPSLFPIRKKRKREISLS